MKEIHTLGIICLTLLALVAEVGLFWILLKGGNQEQVQKIAEIGGIAFIPATVVKGIIEILKHRKGNN